MRKILGNWLTLGSACTSVLTFAPEEGVYLSVPSRSSWRRKMIKCSLCAFWKVLKQSNRLFLVSCPMPNCIYRFRSRDREDHKTSFAARRKGFMLVLYKPDHDCKRPERSCRLDGSVRYSKARSLAFRLRLVWGVLTVLRVCNGTKTWVSKTIEGIPLGSPTSFFCKSMAPHNLLLLLRSYHVHLRAEYSSKMIFRREVWSYGRGYSVWLDVNASTIYRVLHLVSDTV